MNITKKLQARLNKLEDIFSIGRTIANYIEVYADGFVYYVITKDCKLGYDASEFDTLIKNNFVLVSICSTGFDQFTIKVMEAT